MKVYVTFEKQIKEVELPAGSENIPTVRKLACELFQMKPEDVVLRSGTRPMKEDAVLKESHSITMAKVKPAVVAQKEEEEYTYEYEYEEVYEESSGYDASASGDADDDEDVSD